MLLWPPIRNEFILRSPKLSVMATLDLSCGNSRAEAVVPHTVISTRHYFYDKGNAHLMTDSFLEEEKVVTAYRDVFQPLTLPRKY